MRFRRSLVVVDLGADPRGPIGVARRIAPDAERIAAIARRPPAPFPWITPARATERVAESWEAADLLEEALRGAAPAVDVHVALELGADALTAAVQRCEAEVLVAGSSAPGSASIVAEVRRRTGIAVAWAAGVPAAAPATTGPVPAGIHVLCPVGRGIRAAPAFAPFLRDRCGPSDRVTALLAGPPLDGDVTAIGEVTGITARVDVVADARLAPALVGAWAREHAVDVVAVAELPPVRVLDLVARFEIPVLILPPARGPAPGRRAALDVADLVDDGAATLRVRLAQTGALGHPTPIPEEVVTFVAGGHAVATVRSRGGEVELPSAAVRGAALGVGRLARHADPVTAVERQVTVLRPGPERIVLLDAALELRELRTVAATIAGPGAPRLVAVRLRPVDSVRRIQLRWRAAGLGRACAIDASAVLDEGDPDDVPDQADAVRLARVAARMRGAGFAVEAIVHQGPWTPLTDGFVGVRPDGVAGLRAPMVPARPRAASALAARLDATTATVTAAGNRIELELDNATARRWLLEAIEHARARVHVQAYIVSDDEVTREVESALAAAVARGVTVRVLVDSLYSLHRSFGARNALLDRLARRGVEVRASRPIAGLPSIEDLKQRDHRKLVVADGALGIVGGRNLAREYYLGFDEARLTARSSWRDVPWLDAGARVEGPAVAALDRSFLEAWSAAGGEPFEIAEPAPVGPVRARTVVHRGLRDAYTLEAYLALIETARAHVYVVNTFPLQLEVQRALLRAVRRGVAVRALFGHVLPLHGAEPEPFGGPGSSVRSLATHLVHARMDALVAAGAEGYQFSVRGVSGWDPGLGDVRPQVHAKVVSADGTACAVGSANLDITAGYWESELVLLIEDSAVTRALERRLDALVTGSVRVDRADPEWQRLASRRAWLSRHWPALIG